MKRLHPAFFVAALLLPITALPASHTLAEDSLAAASSSPTAANWQLRRLMEPTAAELAREAAGEVVIYGNLTDKQVEAAMSAHPERIRSMMFLGTIVTDENGVALDNPFGPGFVQEDDGC